MKNCLRDLIEQVRNAPTDPFAERVVRLLLEAVAKDCPLPLLAQLGQCVIDYRKGELREEAESN